MCYLTASKGEFKVPETQTAVEYNVCLQWQYFFWKNCLSTQFIGLLRLPFFPRGRSEGCKVQRFYWRPIFLKTWRLLIDFLNSIDNDSLDIGILIEVEATSTEKVNLSKRIIIQIRSFFS